MPVNFDDVFAYETAPTVRFRDWRLGLLNYADYFCREMDELIGVLLFSLLWVLALLPISDVQAKLLFNPTFAADLQRVKRRHATLERLYAWLVFPVYRLLMRYVQARQLQVCIGCS